jgi:hypothetical protein
VERKPPAEKKAVEKVGNLSSNADPFFRERRSKLHPKKGILKDDMSNGNGNLRSPMHIAEDAMSAYKEAFPKCKKRVQ